MSQRGQGQDGAGKDTEKQLLEEELARAQAWRRKCAGCMVTESS